uniref:Integrase catalytic domain-containing protein n=1 Tax=Poecilia mexicana TaxID=48701 RepID=A0A3B3XIK9_9TELE
MLVTDVPTGPWQKVGTDLCHLNGKDYLVIIDYHSNYPEIAQLFNTSAAGVITHMKSVFSRHGIPLVVISDNGPQYNCREFRQFSQDYGFQHITSSPLHPQGNGKAEKGVQIIKRLLKKSSDSGSDPYLALLSYRTAPLACGFSPAELLMGRKLRTTLPHLSLKTNTKQQMGKQTELKLKQKENYDKTARRLRALEENDTVRVEDHGMWERKATVLKEVSPRSYEIRTDDGQVLRRNRRSLLKTQEQDSQKRGQEEIDAGRQARETTGPHGGDNDGNDALPNNTSSTPVLRRSTRTRRPPERLIEQG